MRAVVVGLGKIGLPIAVKIGLAGHEVVGCDIDERVVAQVGAGRAPFPGEAGLEDALAGLIAQRTFSVTSDTTDAISTGPELVIAVPPVGIDSAGRADFHALDAVANEIARGLGPSGTVISVETTVPVGTTRSRVAPLIAERSGLAAEKDFFTVHSPERVYSGRVLADLDAYPKLVGGLSGDGEARAAKLYRAFLAAEVRQMGSAEAAELTKLAETTYRDVNIALANEYARFADRIGVDVQEVIDAANSQPFSHIHRPGIAVGGHCIPVYPHFYLAGDPDAVLPADGRAVNGAMPAYGVDLLQQGLGGNVEALRILILGITYRGSVKETAFSGAFALREELERRGAEVVVADPLYSEEEIADLGFVSWDGSRIDAAVIQADHPQYAALSPDELPGVRALLDGRRVVDRRAWAQAGIAVLRIGQPERAPERVASDPAGA